MADRSVIVRYPKGVRIHHRPSLPLSSLREVDIDDLPRRLSEDIIEKDPQFDDLNEDSSSDISKNSSQNSKQTLEERYTKLDDDEVLGLEILESSRRGSLATDSPSIGKDDKGRRRSWAARLQIERKKRRKSGDEDNATDAPPPGYLKQKRPSWWNIMVPDGLLKNRSRRSSQQLSRSAESIDLVPRRSKSRSVDHGFAAPFDLSALRSKVEERFDVVNKGDGELKRISIVKPIKTLTYTVRDKDTLTSLAAHFDTTPSELTKLNRLATPYIFAGQTLLVPDRKKDGSKNTAELSLDNEDHSGDEESQEPQEKEMLDNLRPQSPETLMPSAPRFLKINVRHITDGQGVVTGVLLVTPNAVMFDPNVSDTLVMEHGAEAYGVIAPMEFVVNAAIFYDIAHMRTPHSDTESLDTAEIYFSKTDAPSERSFTHEHDDEDDKKEDDTVPESSNDTAKPISDSDDAIEKIQENKDKENIQLEANKENNVSDEFALNNQTDSDKPEEKESKPVKENGETVKKNGIECKDDEQDPFDRGGNAFPKAFERDLVTPNNQESRGNQEGRDPGANDGKVDLPLLQMEKLSYHDSGIDIRDPLLNANSINNKKVYSDADIILSTEWIPPVTVAPADPPLSAPPLSRTTPSQTAARPSSAQSQKHASVSFSRESTNIDDDPASKDDPNKAADKRNKMLKRLSYPLAWMEGLTGDGSQSSTGESLPTSADSHASGSAGSVFSKVFNRRSSLGGFGRSNPKTSSSTAPPRLDYRSMVSVDDMPELFVSFDKLIPRPAVPSDEPPLYLRLRMGKPLSAPVAPRTTPLMSYGRKRMKPEYWFGIPRNRVDDLYKFMNHWVPELYGRLDPEAINKRGYQLINEDLEWEEPEYTRIKTERTNSQGEAQEVEVVVPVERDSWELLTVSDELKRALYSTGASLDFDLSPPDLIGNTEILTMDHRQELCAVLPARAQGYMWSLVFSTSQHGFSLSSMYRKMGRVESPVLVVLQDTANNVFGALTSCPLRPSEHFYGTGESFLFSFLPDPNHKEESIDKEDSENSEDEPKPPKTIFKVWNWTGENMYFIRGNSDNISIGAGDGKFGLWLDGDLYQGRTQACTTYGNEPLSTSEDFIVKILECWAFI